MSTGAAVGQAEFDRGQLAPWRVHPPDQHAGIGIDVPATEYRLCGCA